MTYYWIRKEDLQDQEIVDEAFIDQGVVFVKVTDTLGAIFYHKEVMTPSQRKEEPATV